MKFLLSFSLIVLSVVSVSAGYLVPGRPAPFPGHRPPPPAPYPDYGYRPAPPLPPPMPRFDYAYGPGYTVRWQPVGEHSAPKFFEREIFISVGNQYVNELLLTTRDNPVQIISATGILINGQSVDLPRLHVTVGRDQQLIVKIDGYYSLNLSQLILKVTTPTPFGSSASLDIQLGLAR